jgi:hypothetical protein
MEKECACCGKKILEGEPCAALTDGSVQSDAEGFAADSESWTVLCTDCAEKIHTLISKGQI